MTLARAHNRDTVPLNNYSGTRTGNQTLSAIRAGKILGTLRNCNGDGKENVKKAIGLMSTTTTLHVHHAFLYISLPSLHNYDVK